MDIHWDILGFYGYPCIDLVWILDPGLPKRNSAGSPNVYSLIRLNV